MNISPSRLSRVQSPSHLLMVRPKAFGFNSQTAESNGFQQTVSDLSVSEIRKRAVREFDRFVSILKDHKIEVTVFEDLEEPITTDAVFPNNWISFHQNGKIILYPMMAPIRRLERRHDIVDHFADMYPNAEVIDLSPHEEEGIYLEGTGSMIMDRVHQRIYACESARTNPVLFRQFCQQMECEGILFHAVDESGLPIYHTNVMMAVGAKVAVVCFESIHDKHERDYLVGRLVESGHEIVPLTMEQINQFAGNMLEVINQEGKPYMVLSQRAYDSLNPTQRSQINMHSELLPIPLDVIETYGGGSVRCMMAEVFLPA
ncbi:MAG: arginine deiminase-related protein [Bacteroidota bacterium]